MFRQFSFPGSIPSHVAAETPGSIHQGGELGYALVHAYGAAFDNPELVVACVIGNGEAEPAATSVTGTSLGLDYRRPISGTADKNVQPARQRMPAHPRGRIVILIPDRTKIHNSTSPAVELRCVWSVREITPVASIITPITSQLNRSIRVVFTIRSNGIFPPKLACHEHRLLRSTSSSPSRLAESVITSPSRDPRIGSRGVRPSDAGLCTLRICTVLVEAANRLGARPDRRVVIDDAEAGVAAGRAGGFGLVTGVARTGMFSGAVTLLA